MAFEAAPIKQPTAMIDGNQHCVQEFTLPCSCPGSGQFQLKRVRQFPGIFDLTTLRCRQYSCLVKGPHEPS